MDLAILSPPLSQQARRLFEVAEQLAPGSVCHLTFASPDEDRVTLQDNTLLWNGIDLRTVQTVYIHGLAYADPPLPASVGVQDWGLWQARHVEEQQRFSFLFSALLHLQRWGNRVIPTREALLHAFLLPTWLQEIRRSGIRVPALLCSNEGASVEDFTANNRAVVWRPTTGRAAWQWFGAKQRRHLIALDRPPVLLAEVVPGPLMRAYFVGGKPILVLRQQLPRREVEALEGFCSTELPAYLDEVGRTMQGTLGIEWGMVLFVEKEGKPWIYDLDPDPFYGDLPVSYANYLHQALSAWLLGRPTGELVPPVGWEDRATLFQRRMLQILFDMEESKLRPE